MSTPSLKVVVAVTSPIAFHQLKSHNVLQTCIHNAQRFIDSYGSNAHLAVAGTAEQIQGIEGAEQIICDTDSPQSIAQALLNAAPADLIMIHDSQRALTPVAQFDRVLAALTDSIDAVRPASAFTETLKSVNAGGFVEKTIDRSSMMRVSTPELIRFSAIDSDAAVSTWFVGLKQDARTATVDADSTSARINSEQELQLMRVLEAL